MTGLPLPALDGRAPLGFLAALGVLRLVTEHTGHSARLAWSTQDATAVLHDAQPTVDALVDDLVEIVNAILEGGVLPETGSDFPPFGGPKDKLRLTREEFPSYAAQVVDVEADGGERWLASLVTDLVLAADGRIETSQFTAPSGRQTMRTMLREPLALVRAQPSHLREALLAWRRYPGVTGEYLDHKVLFAAVDSADGRSAERGVPGATWLALMSYPLLRTTAVDKEVTTTCWQDLGWSAGRRMVYPVWSEPLDLAAAAALLTHPVLDGAEPGTPPDGARLLSVFQVVHAERRRIPGRMSAGVLTPTTRLVRPPVKAGHR